MDRRRFLLGAGGAALALPMLEAHAPRVAFAQSAAPPKRLVVVLHSHGRTVGSGKVEGGTFQDNWSAGTSTMPLPEGISPLLAALEPIRNEIVTVDGIDNLMRHTTGDADGHWSADMTCLTCMTPNADKSSAGPSLDFVAGERLKASDAQRGALVFPASPLGNDEWLYQGRHFYGVNGTAPTLVNSNPLQSLVYLFGEAPQDDEPEAQKTLKDRLLARRGSILDGVARSYESLSKTASAADRQRLEQHASFIRALETRLAGGGGGALAVGCERPDEANIPTYETPATRRGALDASVTPWQIENLVMALACDVTRVASLHFELNYDPTFPSEFEGDSPLAAGPDFHTMVHDTPALTSPNAEALTRAYQFYGKMFTQLVTRLGEIVDTDGSRLLDNTLVLWVSDLGYGSMHANFNIPVVLAGMGSAFGNGQGRHLVCTERRSLGDLYAQVLRILGGSDTTFGRTGTIGDSGLSTETELNSVAGYEGFITPSLPLHLGELDL